MLRLIGLMLSIGFVDSLNPSTIAPALYFATLERGRALSQLAQFTLGAFLGYWLGGLLITLGPGQLLLSLIPTPHRWLRQTLEIIAALVLLGGAAYLWHRRRQLARKTIPQPRTHGRSAFLIGFTITIVELPTAFPYFAAIVAVIGSGLHVVAQILLLLVFNVMFVSPMLVILAIVRWAGDDAERYLERARSWLDRRWPVILSVIGIAAGLFVLYLGISGLFGPAHESSFEEHLRHLRHHHLDAL